MQKQTVTKKIMICAAAAVLILAAVTAVLFLSRGEEAYRSIMVYELEGSAFIERGEIGTIDAAENLYLESGDRVSVMSDSMMRMKLDDDKYISAEADTVFALEAEGDGDNSRTRIRLEQGSVINEIQKPLGGEELYETTTPNSVMAVRGTIYRAELCDDGAGGQDMRLCCFDGTVAVKPVFPNGAYGDEVLVHAGSELTVYSDGKMAQVKEIDFGSLSEQALAVLRGLMESGAPVMGITVEGLEDLMASSKDDGEAALGRTDTEGTDGQEASVAAETSEEDTLSETKQMLKADEDSEDIDGQKPASGRDKLTAGSGDVKKKPGSDKSGKPSDGADAGKTGTPAADTASSGNVNAGSGGSDNSSSDHNGSGGDTDKPSEDGKPGDDSQEQKPGGDSGSKPNPPKEKTFTVTFEYQGSIFATQTVKNGKKAVPPMLAPAAEGVWDFDFDSKIKADVTIQWKP